MASPIPEVGRLGGASPEQNKLSSRGLLLLLRSSVMPPGSASLFRSTNPWTLKTVSETKEMCQTPVSCVSA